jgi:single-strand DNA-binding protein
MLNKTMLIGNLGADVVSRVTKNQVAVANFTVATSERRKDGEGNFQEMTEWHRIVAFDRLAEICSEYLGKGSKVYIEGRLQTRKWVDGEGVTRYTTEIVAREMKMLGDKGDNVPSAPVDGHEPPLPEDVPF